MRYEIRFKSSAWRAFRKPRGEEKGRLVAAIWGLADNPRPRGCRKLVGKRDLYRIRTGNWRVIYEVQEKTLVVLIIKLGHRREVYRRL